MVAALWHYATFEKCAIPKLMFYLFKTENIIVCFWLSEINNNIFWVDKLECTRCKQAGLGQPWNFYSFKKGKKKSKKKFFIDFFAHTGFQNQLYEETNSRES